jgi:hypothetical protein
MLQIEKAKKTMRFFLNVFFHRLFWSGRAESNCRLLHGKEIYYHYTTPAHTTQTIVSAEIALINCCFSASTFIQVLLSPEIFALEILTRKNGDFCEKEEPPKG